MQETEKLRFSKKIDTPIGVNYGIVKHNPNSAIKETFALADELMEKDKKKMYLKYGIDRRHI